MSIYKLKPACKDYLWGGHRLVDDYGIEFDGDICAEAWLLSCHKDGKSTIAGGQYAGKTLEELIDIEGQEILGTNCRDFEDFPILIKLIDARNPLSIQVHPGEEYARRNEGQHGKTEMWYVLDAREGAFLYQGFEQEISREEFEERIKNNTLEEVLHKEFVKKGDVIFITPGTLHAIGAGVLVAEIQQSSNVTYRIYDYGRVGSDGKTRPLHIRQALDVTRIARPDKLGDYGKYLLSCEYFNVERAEITEGGAYDGCVDNSSFASIIVLEGDLEIEIGSEKTRAAKGESVFIPAGLGKYKISGTGEVLVTTIP